MTEGFPYFSAFILWTFRATKVEASPSKAVIFNTKLKAAPAYKVLKAAKARMMLMP